MATTTATVTIQAPATANSVLWSHDVEGHIVCEDHAGFYLADILNIRRGMGQNPRVVNTPLGPWRRMTAQRIADYQYAVRSLPLWGDYPCDTCRTEVERAK